MKKIIVRSTRKGAHISTKVLSKAVRLTAKVEDKTSRMLNGIDFSVKVEDSIPFEKVYYNSLPEITPINPAMPAVGSVPTVTLFLPTLDNSSFFGGTATALVVAAKAAIIADRPLKIVQTLKTGSHSDLKGFLNKEGVVFENKIEVVDVSARKYNFYGYINMHPEDIFIASAWWDAHLISQLPLTQKFIYLIQDFEPIFYNNSDSYILAESTYKTDGFIPLCNTKLMYDFMKKRNYPAFKNTGDKNWFEPAVSRAKNGIVVKKKSSEKKRLFLYGRPGVHRNLFFTALNSIDYALKASFIDSEEWELFMAGQDNIPDIQLTSGLKVKNLGKMSMKDYVAFSKTVDLAISPMMAPHPNYPTLEFASIGSAVVTTKYANKVDLGKYSKNIVVTDIGVESVAGAIKQAAQKSYKGRVENIKNNSISDSWTTIDDKVKGILKEV